MPSVRGLTDLKESSFDTTKKYIILLKDLIVILKKDKPKDRLEYSVALSNCMNCILSSINGWKQWLNNLKSLNALSIEDFKEVYPEIREISIRFLEADVNMTKKKLAEATKAYNKAMKKKEKAEQKEPYIS